MTRGVHDPDDPGRPVRRPGNTEYDLALGKSLSAGAWDKARLLPFLPLFFVAADGRDGLKAATLDCRERGRKTA